MRTTSTAVVAAAAIAALALAGCSGGSTPADPQADREHADPRGVLQGRRVS